MLNVNIVSLFIPQFFIKLLFSPAFLHPFLFKFPFCLNVATEFLLWNCSTFIKTLEILTGNPFECEWLVRVALTSKNIRLGRKNYVVSSKHDIMKVAGIECFEDNRANVQRLIVVETTHEADSEVLVRCLLSLFLPPILEITSRKMSTSCKSQRPTFPLIRQLQ